MTTKHAAQSRRSIRGFALQIASQSLPFGLCVLCVAFCFSHTIKAQERSGAVGHVLDIEGDWLLDGRANQSLGKGEELPGGGVIRIHSPSSYAFIIVRYADNQIVKRYCRNRGECDQPILLPRVVQQQSSFLGSIVARGMAMFRRDPVSPSVNAGRSADGTLREAVLQIKDGQIDLSNVFSEMKNGDYDVLVARRMPDGKALEGGTTKQMQVKWDSGKATTAAAINLQAGLYELTLLEKRGGELKPTLTTAWFLASNPEQYAQTAAQFDEAARLTATWKKDVSEATARSFLRAFLIDLASETQSPQTVK